jgi:hypothetical protein
MPGQNILLIDPIYNPGTVPPNVSLGKLETVLSTKDNSVTVVDFVSPDCEHNDLSYFKHQERTFIDNILTQAQFADLIYITTGHGNELKPYPIWPRIHCIASEIKRQFPTKKIIVDGALVNLYKKHYLKPSFAQYSAVYITTNENLRYMPHYMPKETNQVLTVAASGDHPMFAKLYGAKYVDTFDISFNAKLIMDIKTSALSLLNYKEYCKLLKDLYKTKDVMRVKNMQQIIEKFTAQEQQYITEMRERPLFNQWLSIFSLPTKTEFEKMRQIINQPFNFIWSDIQTLHQKLTNTYDFIHLSNIFDYVGTYQNCINILESLMPHTVPGCNICFTCFDKDPEAICERFIWEQTLKHNTEQLWTANKIQNMTDTCIIQRIR